MNNSILKIKVCGLKYPTNIEAIAALNPDFMGFIFYEKSPRFFVEKQLIQIPNHIKKIGVFVDHSQDEMLKKIEELKLDGLQLHGNEGPEVCEFFHAKNYTILKAFAINENFDFSTLEPYENSVDYFLFDTAIKGQSGGTGKKFDWELLEKYSLTTPFLLSGGIGPEDAETILEIDHPRIVGVDINSQFEIEPGRKNIEWLSTFIKNIREA